MATSGELPYLRKGRESKTHEPSLDLPYAPVADSERQEVRGKANVVNDICCSSVARSCPTLCDPMDCSTPGFPDLHCLSEFVQTHVR